MSIMTDQRRILIEARFGNRKKSVGIAYLLLICTGVGQNFYLGRPWRGVLQFLLCFVAIGVFWILCDYFTLAGTVRTMNEKLYGELTQEALLEA